MKISKKLTYDELHIIVSNFIVAIISVLCFNVMLTIIIQWTPLLSFDYFEVVLSFENGFVVLNNIPFGIPIIANVLFFLISWYLLTITILIPEKSTLSHLYPSQINKVLRKVIHIFF